MEQKSITLTRGQVKGIYEYFASQLQQEGKTAEFSYLIYKNTETLAQEYANIVNTIYDENSDEKFQEFTKKSNELVVKYADRDEQGNPIVENNNYKITEQIVEFKQENETLYKEYEEVLKNRQQKIQESVQFLEMTSEYSLIVMPIAKFPDKIAPAIVGIFGI